MLLDLGECAVGNLPVAVFHWPSVEQPADGSGAQLDQDCSACGATGRWGMAFRDNGQRPDMGALLAMAEELVATSHELNVHARNVVERSRLLRARVQARSNDVVTGRAVLGEGAPDSDNCTS